MEVLKNLTFFKKVPTRSKNILNVHRYVRKNAAGARNVGVS